MCKINIETIEGLQELLEKGKDYLHIDRGNLDRVIMEQPVLYEKIGRAAAIAKSYSDSCYDNLKRTDAEVSLLLRQDLENEGRRVTESTLQSMVMASEEHKQAFEKSVRARRLSEEVAALRDSFIQRSYMIKELVQLFVSDYFSISSVKTSDSRNNFANYEDNLEIIKRSRSGKKDPDPEISDIADDSLEGLGK